MKLKLSELKNAEPALRKLLNSDLLNVKTAYRLGRSISKIDSELTQLEATRVRLVNKYGQKDKKGTITVKKENIEKFTQDMSKLLSMDVNLSIEPISLADLPDNIGLSPVDLNALSPLIKIPEGGK
jgi:single-stranded DNA-specific DHH superfamily exonuclease